LPGTDVGVASRRIDWRRFASRRIDCAGSTAPDRLRRTRLPDPASDAGV